MKQCKVKMETTASEIQIESKEEKRLTEVSLQDDRQEEKASMLCFKRRKKSAKARKPKAVPKAANTAKKPRKCTPEADQPQPPGGAWASIKCLVTRKKRSDSSKQQQSLEAKVQPEINAEDADISKKKAKSRLKIPCIKFSKGVKRSSHSKTIEDSDYSIKVQREAESLDTKTPTRSDDQATKTGLTQHLNEIVSRKDGKEVCESNVSNSITSGEKVISVELGIDTGPSAIETGTLLLEEDIETIEEKQSVLPQQARPPETSEAERQPPQVASEAERHLPQVASEAERQPPPVASEAERQPPPVASEAERQPPHVASEAERQPPPVASEAERQPPPVASEAERQPPPVASEAERHLPPVASEAERQPPPVASEAERQPPPVASEAERHLPPVASEAERQPPPVASEAERQPPPVASEAERHLPPVASEGERHLPPVASEAERQPPVASDGPPSPAVPDQQIVEVERSSELNGEDHESREIVVEESKPKATELSQETDFKENEIDAEKPKPEESKRMEPIAIIITDTEISEFDVKKSKNVPKQFLISIENEQMGVFANDSGFEGRTSEQYEMLLIETASSLVKNAIQLSVEQLVNEMVSDDNKINNLLQ